MSEQRTNMEFEIYHLADGDVHAEVRLNLRDKDGAMSTRRGAFVKGTREEALQQMVDLQTDLALAYSILDNWGPRE